MSKHLIHGSGNKVTLNTNRVALINCDDIEVTEEDNGKTIIGNGSLIVEYGGKVNGNFTFYQTEILNDTQVQSDKQSYIFFVDATLGNINIELFHGSSIWFFIRRDATINTVTLTPNSGLINGAGSYGLNVQFEKVTVVSDGTDFYF